MLFRWCSGDIPLRMNKLQGLHNIAVVKIGSSISGHKWERTPMHTHMYTHTHTRTQTTHPHLCDIACPLCPPRPRYCVTRCVPQDDIQGACRSRSEPLTLTLTLTLTITSLHVFLHLKEHCSAGATIAHLACPNEDYKPFMGHTCHPWHNFLFFLREKPEE